MANTAFSMMDFGCVWSKPSAWRAVSDASGMIEEELGRNEGVEFTGSGFDEASLEKLVLFPVFVVDFVKMLPSREGALHVDHDDVLVLIIVLDDVREQG